MIEQALQKLKQKEIELKNFEKQNQLEVNNLNQQIAALNVKAKQSIEDLQVQIMKKQQFLNATEDELAKMQKDKEAKYSIALQKIEQLHLKINQTQSQYDNGIPYYSYYILLLFFLF